MAGDIAQTPSATNVHAPPIGTAMANAWRRNDPAEWHAKRRAEMLRAHPKDLAGLRGHNPWSAAIALGYEMAVQVRPCAQAAAKRFSN